MNQWQYSLQIVANDLLANSRSNKAHTIQKQMILS